MCDSHQPEAGADSGLMVGPIAVGWPADIWNSDEPVQVACGHWIENENGEGFCALEPGHEQGCQPPKYEDLD